MARLALIDDDPVEALVLEGLLDHAAGGHGLSRFSSVETFVSAGGAGVDLVLLDRRVPPHQSFASGLQALSRAPYRGPVLLITAGACEEGPPDWPGPLHGPVDKADLLTPEGLARLIDRALAEPRPGARL